MSLPSDHCSERRSFYLQTVLAMDKAVFDVRGKSFSIALRTLNRYPDSWLPAMCEDCSDDVRTGKKIYIDRDPEKFGWILDIYRGSGKRKLPSKWSLKDIQDELDFYQLPPAADLLIFRGEMLVGMETATLETLAEEISSEMCRIREQIMLTSFARFLVWTELKDRTKLHVEHMDNAARGFSSSDVQSFVKSIKRFRDDGTTVKKKGRWIAGGNEILSLTSKHVTMLSKVLFDLGFKVTREMPTDCTEPPVSLLKVTWNL